jgi:hypothetical protein
MQQWPRQKGGAFIARLGLFEIVRRRLSLARVDDDVEFDLLAFSETAQASSPFWASNHFTVPVGIFVPFAPLRWSTGGHFPWRRQEAVTFASPIFCSKLGR